MCYGSCLQGPRTADGVAVGGRKSAKRCHTLYEGVEANKKDEVHSAPDRQTEAEIEVNRS